MILIVKSILFKKSSPGTYFLTHPPTQSTYSLPTGNIHTISRATFDVLKKVRIIVYSRFILRHFNQTFLTGAIGGLGDKTKPQRKM